MTAPTPPPLHEVDPLVRMAHAIRDEAELVLTRYRIAIIGLVMLAAFASWQGYEWHLRNLARLEAQSSVERMRATNEHALGEKWKARAIALTDSVTVDTVRVRQIIEHTRTVMVPVAPPPAQDGVTYSVPLPMQPIPMVARVDFDSLASACTRTEHDCGSALAAKDSVIAHQDSVRAALDALNANTAKQLRIAKRAAIWQKLLWGAAGLVIGRAIR